MKIDCISSCLLLVALHSHYTLFVFPDLSQNNVLGFYKRTMLLQLYYMFFSRRKYLWNSKFFFLCFPSILCEKVFSISDFLCNVHGRGTTICGPPHQRSLCSLCSRRIPSPRSPAQFRFVSSELARQEMFQHNTTGASCAHTTTC